MFHLLWVSSVHTRVQRGDGGQKSGEPGQQFPHPSRRPVPDSPPPETRSSGVPSGRPCGRAPRGAQAPRLSGLPPGVRKPIIPATAALADPPRAAAACRDPGRAPAAALDAHRPGGGDPPALPAPSGRPAPGLTSQVSCTPRAPPPSSGPA